jgi:flagellar motor switch protein FliG
MDGYQPKPKLLFEDFFKKCSPKTFCLMFQNEHPQIVSCILSFCNNNNFIKKVLKLYRYDTIMTNNIVNFMAKCEGKKYVKEVIESVERYCTIRLGQYEEKCRSYRKNHNFNLPL